MTSSPKPPLSKSASSPAELRGVSLYRVAIVGAASLKGKEVAEILRERNFPAVDVRLLDDDESLGQLEAIGDEMNFIQSIRSDQFERVDFAFFSSDSRSTRNNWKAARDLGDTIVDLSYALEEEAGASVRSPWIEAQSGQPHVPELQPGPVVVAHPAATVLAMLALRAEKAAKVGRMTAIVFEPASEIGQMAMDELHEQTVNLLSFQDLPKNVFDMQVAFNMTAQYGSRSKFSLETVAQRIRKHYEHIAHGAVQPSLQVLQCRYFTATPSRSTWNSRGRPRSLLYLRLGWGSCRHRQQPRRFAHQRERCRPGRYPRLAQVDPNQANGAWIWATTDNLRIAASNRGGVCRIMTTSRPTGSNSMRLCVNEIGLKDEDRGIAGAPAVGNQLWLSDGGQQG